MKKTKMTRRIISLLLAVVLLVGVMAVGFTTNAAAGCLKRNVYYAYSMSATDLANIDVDAFKITHLCYAFIKVTSSGKLTSGTTEPASGQSYYVDSSTASKLNALKQLKAKYPNLKVLLSIGGGSQSQDDYFRGFITSSTARKNFAQGCADLVNDYGLDGIDLDWEHPDTAAESDAYTTLCETLRSSSYLGAKGNGKLLTIAFPVSSSYVNKIIINDIDRLNDCLDFWNLMTYDLGDSASFEFIAPLYRKDSSSSQTFGFSSVSEGVGYYHDAGVAYEDMTLGVPFYGKRIYNFSKVGDITFGEESSSISYEKPDYNEIIDYIGKSGWEERWCEGAKCPYLVYSNSTSGGQKVITETILYDNARSLGYKLDYAESLGLGGMMVWSYKGDDSNDTLKKVLAERINYNGSSSGGDVDGGEDEPVTPPAVVNEPDETPVVLFQDFGSVAPTISGTNGDRTNGAWSISNASNGTAHGTLATYVNTSTGSTSLRAQVVDGRYSFTVYCGCTEYSPYSRVKFRLWVPTDCEVDSLSVKAGSTEILAETALTAGTWHEFTTDMFGETTDGRVRLDFKASSGTISDSIYIDDFIVYDDLTDVSVLYQNYETAPQTSATAGDTTHGVWSSAVSSSTGAHTAFSQFTTSSGISDMMKVDVGDGRYTIDSYCGFSGADADSTLTFKVWVPADSTVTKINAIKIGETTILGETALTPGEWNTIQTSAFGEGNTEGALHFTFYSASAAASQCYYIDDFTITKPVVDEVVPPVEEAKAEYIVFKVGQIKAYASFLGGAYESEAETVVVDGKAFVPMRFSSILLEANCGYEGGVITLNFGDYTVECAVDSTKATLTNSYGSAGIDIPADQTPRVINGKTYLPARVLNQFASMTGKYTISYLDNSASGSLGHFVVFVKGTATDAEVLTTVKTANSAIMA